MKDKRSKFLKIYPNIPDNLRSDIIVVIDGKTYSWNVCYFEIKNNTPLSKKILKALSEIDII